MPSSLTAWLSYIERIHFSTIDLGLDRLELVMKNLSLPKLAPLVITVAGTNGKGTTCALIENILLDAGYRVGVYSSPHLIDYKERVRINGVQLDEQEHCDAFSYIEHNRGETSLSFFEYATLAAFRLFTQHALDVVILEVGLGGRLDATNIVDPDIAVVTSLALDHTDWLGNTLEEIGYEKAGIFRKDKPVVCGCPNPPASIAAYADEIGADLYQIGYKFTYKINENSWNWHSGAFDLPDLPIPNIHMNNAATAIMVLGLTELELSDENIVAGLTNTLVAGRFQQISEHPKTILDVAHNPQAAEYLAQKLSNLNRGNGRVRAVVGMLHDKDINNTLRQVRDYIDDWYLADLDTERGATAKELQQVLDSLGTKKTSCYNAPIKAWYQAKKDAGANDILLIFGSFYTVSDVYGEVIDKKGTHD